jgi:hypothetical protein
LSPTLLLLTGGAVERTAPPQTLLAFLPPFAYLFSCWLITVAALSSVEGSKGAEEIGFVHACKHVLTDSRVVAAKLVDVSNGVVVREYTLGIETNCEEANMSVVHPARDVKHSLVSDRNFPEASFSSHADKDSVSR